MRRDTGLKDKGGRVILEDDRVSLDGNMTADDGMGFLPNGYFFDEDDVYPVFFDESIGKWALDCGIKPDSSENIHFLNHACALLHSGDCVVVS